MGLPRGIRVSAWLSELAMDPFDKALRTAEGVYFYARFADDIIIFCNTEADSKRIYDFADEQLGKQGLRLNEEKSAIWNDKKDIPLQFLGYSFDKDDKCLRVDIAASKMDKLKTRLTKALVHFAKDNNYDLLRIFKLDASKKERRVQWMEFDMNSVDEKNPSPKDFIPFEACKYGKRSYLITVPVEALSPGQYAIVYTAAEQNNMMPVSTFAVE